MTSSQNYRNVALVAGEGEGLDRKTIPVGAAEGMERYELYVDARDVSSNEGRNHGTGIFNTSSRKRKRKVAGILDRNIF